LTSLKSLKEKKSVTSETSSQVQKPVQHENELC